MENVVILAIGNIDKELINNVNFKFSVFWTKNMIKKNITQIYDYLQIHNIFQLFSKN